MRKEYDFSKAVSNPYASKLKRQITIRLDDAVIDYFKLLAKQLNISYQILINLYLRECAAEKKTPVMKWIPQREQIAGFVATPRRKTA